MISKIILLFETQKEIIQNLMTIHLPSWLEIFMHWSYWFNHFSTSFKRSFGSLKDTLSVVNDTVGFFEDAPEKIKMQINNKTVKNDFKKKILKNGF